MAGTPSAITNQALDNILRIKVELPVHRAAAALLTVAFEICKDGHHSRGEMWTDDQVKDEVKQIYYDFISVTDPQMGVQAARRP
jgi:hypothetical protein